MASVLPPSQDLGGCASSEAGAVDAHQAAAGVAISAPNEGDCEHEGGILGVALLSPALERAAQAYHLRDFAALQAGLGELHAALSSWPEGKPGSRAAGLAMLDRLAEQEMLGNSLSGWLAKLLLMQPAVAEEAASLLDELPAWQREEVLEYSRFPNEESCAGPLLLSVSGPSTDFAMATGKTIWSGSASLAQLVLQAEELSVRGLRVLELGAGLGLAGLACARAGAAAVCFTDYDPVLLQACRRSAALNSLENVVSTHVLDWAAAASVGASGDADHSSVESLGSWDLLIGGEVFYGDAEKDQVLMAAMGALLRVTSAQEFVAVSSRLPQRMQHLHEALGLATDALTACGASGTCGRMHSGNEMLDCQVKLLPHPFIHDDWTTRPEAMRLYRFVLAS